jgi:hypothetical protein
MIPLYATLRVIGFSPEAAFQGWFVIPFLLNFVSAAWALRQIGPGSAGVAAGAFVFAFGLPIAAQIEHAQLLPRFFVPLAALFGWEFLRSPRTSRLAACSSCTVFQIYTSVYIGYFLVLLLAAGFVIALIGFRSQLPWTEFLHPSRRVLYSRAIVIVASALCLIPLARAHSKTAGSKNGEYIRSIAPTLKAWLTPHQVAITAPYLMKPQNLSHDEQSVFPGFVALLAIGIGLVASLRARLLGGNASIVALAAWSALLLMLVVTVFDELWLYRLVVELPGGCTVRAIGRIVLVLLFPMAIAISACVDAFVGWAARFGRTATFLAGVVAVAIVAADNWLCPTNGVRASVWTGERVSLEQVLARQDRIKEAIERHPKPTLIYAFPSKAVEPYELAKEQIDVMRAAQDVGISCVNGYSGYVPSGWQIFTNKHELMTWLETQHAPAEKLPGLVVIENPQSDTNRDR